MNNTYALLIVAVAAAVTQGLRFLPFTLWGGKKKTPEYILWLGNILPYAIMGMLVVYCLKGVDFSAEAGFAGWLPAAVSVVLVAVLQAWRRSSLLSIIAGTICYMILIQIV